MPRPRLNNARILDWLGHELDEGSDLLGAPKVQVNSVAIWWFCTRLTPEERATLVGEFVSENARRVQAGLNGKPHKPRRGRKSGGDA